MSSAFAASYRLWLRIPRQAKVVGPILSKMLTRECSTCFSLWATAIFPECISSQPAIRIERRSRTAKRRNITSPHINSTSPDGACMHACACEYAVSPVQRRATEIKTALRSASMRGQQHSGKTATPPGTFPFRRAGFPLAEAFSATNRSLGVG